MKTLDRWNLAGVIALSILCLCQWHRNRQLNQKLSQQNQRAHELVSQLSDRQESLTRAHAESIQFKEQLARVEVSEARLKSERAQSLALVTRLELEGSHLRQAISNWQEAVAIRDRRISQADTTQRQFTKALEEAALRYNQLVTNYNTLVQQSKTPLVTPPQKPETVR